MRVGLAQLAAWCALGLLALWAAGRLWPVLWPLLWPFLAGAIVALAVEPVVGWLVSRGMRRATAAVLCLGAGLFAGCALTAWAVLITWTELWRLKGRLPALYTAASAALAEVGRRAGAASQGLPPGVRVFLEHELRRGYAGGVPLLQRLVAGLQHGVSVVPDALFAFFIAFAAAYFAVRDRDGLAGWIDRHLPAESVRALREAARSLHDSVWGMVRAQLLLAAVTFLVSLAGLWLVGAPYVMLAALAAGLLDALPVVGPAALYLPWMVGCALSGMGGAAIALAAVMVAVAAARWLLMPHLLGAQVGLHPFVALATMYVGVHLAGLAGLLLGPLAASAARGLLAGPPAPVGGVPPPRTGGNGAGFRPRPPGA